MKKLCIFPLMYMITLLTACGQQEPASDISMQQSSNDYEYTQTIQENVNNQVYQETEHVPVYSDSSEHKYYPSDQDVIMLDTEYDKICDKVDYLINWYPGLDDNEYYYNGGLFCDCLDYIGDHIHSLCYDTEFIRNINGTNKYWNSSTVSIYIQISDYNTAIAVFEMLYDKYFEGTDVHIGDRYQKAYVGLYSLSINGYDDYYAIHAVLPGVEHNY